MSTIPVDLPDDLRHFVDAKVQHGLFANANEYIVALVDAAARSKRSDIEAALIEGLRSGPTEEWTSGEWADIKQRVIERYSLLPPHSSRTNSLTCSEVNAQR